MGTFAALGSFLYGYDLTIVAEGESTNAPYIPKVRSEELTNICL